MSEVEDLNGAISIAWPKPIRRGPITFDPPKVYIVLYVMAALCCPGIIKMLALPTISDEG